MAKLIVIAISFFIIACELGYGKIVHQKMMELAIEAFQHEQVSMSAWNKQLWTGKPQNLYPNRKASIKSN